MVAGERGAAAARSRRRRRSSSRGRRMAAPAAAAGARAGRTVRRAAAGSAAAGLPAALATDEPRARRRASPLSWALLLGAVALTVHAVWYLAAQPAGGALAAAVATDGGQPASWAATLAAPDVQRVIWYGWITAASTGLGALPFVRSGGALSPRALAGCNALAGGMMLAAAGLLLHEGATHEAHALEQLAAARAVVAADSGDSGGWALAAAVALSAVSPLVRALVGVALGVVFILASKRVLDQHEDLKLSGFQGADARRVILVVGVMALHSFTEGIGLGVSFGSQHDGFGALISATLAIHNVPEGLAVVLALLTSQGVPLVDCALWAIATSLPQPLTAVPAYLQTRYFMPVMPVGLGLAAGAMCYVALAELLAEAAAALGAAGAAAVALPAALLMVASHQLMH